MSGSSRSLLRALDAVFGLWDSLVDWEADAPSTIIAVYSVIDAYNEKHNSIATLAMGLSDSLRTCYKNYVRNAGELSKEVFFVEILTRLLPMLTSEDVKLWLQTYLRPALNSAGLDLNFVEKARKFLLSLSKDIMDSEDPDLVKRRQSTSVMVMDYILRAFIGMDKEVYRILDLIVDEEVSSTHEHIERLRFVEKNACLLLKEVGLQRPIEFFTLLNKHFVLGSERHKTLVLLAQISSSRASGVQTIVDTPLFANLLRSLLHDFSESVITSDLYVLLMLLAKVCNKVTPYISDLFGIISRLTGWSEFSKCLATREKVLMDYLKSHSIEWDRVPSDQESAIMQSQLFVEGEFNLLYLMTMLYALFPMNLIEFSKSPIAYWDVHPPKLVTIDHIKTLKSSSFPAGFAEYVSEKLKEQCRRFMLHPNMLNLVTPEQELTEPIKWILDANVGETVREEEVLLECYQLNPDLILTVPDSLILPHWVVEKIHGHTNFHKENRIYSAKGSLLLSTCSNSMRNSISLSNGDSERTNSISKLSVPIRWETIDRRMSIVNTKLVIDNSKNPTLNDSQSEGIKFKSVNFGTANNESLETGTLDEKSSFPEPNKKGSISELYQAHERLFTPNNSANNQLDLNVSHSPIATGSIQTATKTASDLLNKQLKSEANDSIAGPKLNDQDTTSTIGREGMGSALDFYQRELLLIKNEMEFSSYMKHLNKFNYLKLKLRLNRILRDNLAKSSENTREEFSNIEAFQAYQELLIATKEAESAKSIAIETKEKEIAQLLHRISELQNKLVELEATIDKLESEKSDSIESLAIAKENERVSLTQFHKLQNELQVLQKENENLLNRQKAPELEPANISHDHIPTLEQHEKEIFDLKTEIRICKDENAKIAQELEQANESLEYTTKSYEKQLATIKLDKGLAVREMSSHYERKIQELNIAIAKFESTLDELNARIVQLSTSKPIRIPESTTENYQMVPTHHNNSIAKYRQSSAEIGGPDLQSGPTMHDYFSHRGNSILSFESTSLSPNPSIPNHLQKHPASYTPTSRQSSSQNIPILRGRGGYQKRSKKIM